MALDKALFFLGLGFLMVKRGGKPILSPRALTFDSNITSPREERKRGGWAVTFIIAP